GRQLTERDEAYILRLQSHLTKSYLLANEPWGSPRILPEYIQSKYSDPPVMFFGIGLQLTTMDLLPVAETLKAPISSPGDGGLKPMTLVWAIRRAVQHELKAQIENWGIISPSTILRQVICITDNSLDRLSHKHPNVDDGIRLRTIKWKYLQNSAEVLRELTGREPKWYIGDYVHNSDWPCRSGYSLQGV
ncbi:uncharacterized protein EI90DRAFT_2848295, partial [Cantharellus anzutake]|uniref:uncharacterized protein n=1 Tax=Cantharellus anzutake TaxID=1750568 RepID=UPI0019040945